MSQEYKNVIADAVIDGFTIEGISVSDLASISLDRLDSLYGAIAPCDKQKSLKEGGSSSATEKRALKLLEALYRTKDVKQKTEKAAAVRAEKIAQLEALLEVKELEVLKSKSPDELRDMIATLQD